MLVELVALLISVCVIVYVYISRRFSYCKKRNVSTIPTTFLFGNLNLHHSMGTNFHRIYNSFKAAGEKTHGGIYNVLQIVYFPMDVDIIKNILAKDHTHFNSRGIYTNPNQPISEHLVALSGEKWRYMRHKISPTFTSGKLKTMFELLENCSYPMIEAIDVTMQEPLNIKDILMRFTIDVIGSCAFGLDCNSFKNEDLPFLKMGLKVVRPTKSQMIFSIFAFVFPETAKFLNYKSVPTEAERFYSELIDDVSNYRKQNKITRNDFIQMMLDMTDGVSRGEENAFTMDMVKAQAFIFLIAGFETSSSTMTFALFELGRRMDIQDRARKEIKEVLGKHGGRYTYEAIMEMKYLNQVVEETLRFYPIASFLSRLCTSTYKEPKTGIVIEKGIAVTISVMGIHHDPEHYPEPEVFDPERFSNINKAKRNPYTYLPFGEGNMLCVGIRFAMMQTKMGLAKLLDRYIFTLSEKTKLPLEYDVGPFLAPKEDIYLNVKRVD